MLIGSIFVRETRVEVGTKLFGKVCWFVDTNFYFENKRKYSKILMQFIVYELIEGR